MRLYINIHLCFLEKMKNFRYNRSKYIISRWIALNFKKFEKGQQDGIAEIDSCISGHTTNEMFDKTQKEK